MDINPAVVYRVLPRVEYEQSGQAQCQFLKTRYCFASTSEQLLVHVILVYRCESLIGNVLILL